MGYGTVLRWGIPPNDNFTRDNDDSELSDFQTKPILLGINIMEI